MVYYITTYLKFREIVFKNYCHHKTIREVINKFSILETTVWDIIKYYGDSRSILQRKQQKSAKSYNNS